jgi:hypothetical protein
MPGLYTPVNWTESTPLHASHFNTMEQGIIENNEALRNGTHLPTSSRFMRRDSAGRARVIDPSHGQDIANRQWVEAARNNTLHIFNRQAFASSAGVNLSVSGNTGVTMGTVTLPSGWAGMDLELYGYFETAMLGVTHWRYLVEMQALISGSWTRTTGVSQAISVIRNNNASGTWVYTPMPIMGWVTNMRANVSVRFVYIFSTAGGVNTSNREYRSTRRKILVVKRRRV